MDTTRRRDAWSAGDCYEPYVGRWSRRVAAVFVERLAVPRGRRWADVGCGTGALTHAILERCDPAAVTGIDASAAFVEHARAHTSDARATFLTGDAQALPLPDASVDAAVSGLVLNFVPEPARAAAEMARVVGAGGVVGVYVWDYAEGMALMRRFWDAAAALDPAAAALDEGRRFPLCRPEPLAALLEGAGLRDVEVAPIDIETPFRDFDDYWSPFLGGQGPAPGYAMALTAPRRAALRERLRETLPAAGDGTIALTARAWAAHGRTP
jgi:SAM-dependent methyltransferase